MNKKTLTILILAIPATLLFFPSLSLGSDPNIRYIATLPVDGEYVYAQSGVPEPAVMGLLIIGCAGFLIFRLRSAICRRGRRRRTPTLI